jgi:hypothetical protein
MCSSTGSFTEPEHPSPQQAAWQSCSHERMKFFLASFPLPFCRKKYGREKRFIIDY